MENPALIIALATAVAGPLVIWLLNRMGVAGEIRKLDLYIKKLEIATKLKQLEKELGTSENLDWGPLKEEISNILSAISEEQQTVKRALGHYQGKLSFFRRIFIWYKPVSLGSWVLHFYFYLCVLNIIFYPSNLIMYFLDPSGDQSILIIGDLLQTVIIIFSNVLLAYMTRKWAIYLLKKNAPENKYFG